MEHSELLDEIATNRREISHERFGDFIIKRPSNRVLSLIDSAKTRSMNKDLQTKEALDSGGYVPAYLTKKSKKRLLQEHGEWTQEDDDAIELAQSEYRLACMELDKTNFESVDMTLAELDEIKSYLLDKGLDPKKFKKELSILFPGHDDGPSEELAPLQDGYDKAKKRVVAALKDVEATRVLDGLDGIHKQYYLIQKGIEAQAKLFLYKTKELSLFSDTVESRAENAGHIAKISNCVYTPEENLYFTSPEKCRDSEQDMLAWLLQEVEKFERLDPTMTAEDEVRMNRFNFLFPSVDINASSEDSQDLTESKQDGSSAKEIQNNSSED